jgi:hypothetical protein
MLVRLSRPHRVEFPLVVSEVRSLGPERPVSVREWIGQIEEGALLMVSL